MPTSVNQNLIAIEGAATYERILTVVRDVETDEAIRNINDFLKIYPELGQAHNDIAVLYYRDGNPLRALAHYEKAHKLDPGNVTYRKNLADFYFVELQWTGDAIQTYLGILKDNPFDVEAINALGAISLQIGRKEQARQYFTRTLQLDGNNMEARQGMEQLGALPAAPSDTPRISGGAQMTCQGAPAVVSAPASRPIAASLPNTRLEPTRSADELYREALRRVDADEFNEAIQLLETLVTQDHDNAVAHNDLGVLYQKRGDLQKSRHQLETAVLLQPANAIFQKNLADILCCGFGELEGALTIYVKLFAENRNDIELLKAMAYICMEVGKPADARFFLERVVSVKPWDQDAVEALQAIRSAVAQ